MPLRLTTAYHSVTGLREQNEDFVGMVAPRDPERSSKGMIAAIADGVSGSDGGREAAEYCVRGLLTDYYAAADTWPVTQSLDKMIKAINCWLHQQGGMATTLTVLVMRGEVYYFAHVGDTRLYLLRDGELTKLTNDHVDDRPEFRHVLTRAIGLGSELTIDHGMGELRVGDIFLLASDGVWGAMPNDDLSWHLSELIDDKRSADGTAKLLTDAALAGGSTDNASVLIVRIDQLTMAQTNPLTWGQLILAVSLLVSLLLSLLVLK